MAAKLPFETTSKWSITDKKRLARLLAIYPVDAYESIAPNFPKKSMEEVKAFIKKMVYSTNVVNASKLNDSLKGNKGKAPLEVWLEVVSSLVEKEQFDFSSCLSKVMAFISSFEEFPEGDLEGHPQPNYKSIYKYLSHILDVDRRDDTEELGPLESAVVLDLILSLMEALSDCDVIVQKNVMLMKYLLLNERDSYGHPVPELLQKASENDFSALFNWREGYKAAFHHDDNAEDNDLETIENSTKEDESTYSTIGNEKNPKKFIACYTYEANYKADETPKRSDPHLYLNKEVYHNKPGRKLIGTKNQSTKVTEIVRVVPPPNATIVQVKPRNKRQTFRKDGKYFGINVSGHLQLGDDIYDKTVKDFSNEGEEVVKSRKRKYDTLKLGGRKGTKKEVKKPKMYSLNPFCVPISLLDLDA